MIIQTFDEFREAVRKQEEIFFYSRSYSNVPYVEMEKKFLISIKEEEFEDLQFSGWVIYTERKDLPLVKAYSKF